MRKLNAQGLGLIWVMLTALNTAAQDIAIVKAGNAWPVCIASNAEPTVGIAAAHFADDIELVTGVRPRLLIDNASLKGNVIIAGTLDNSVLLQQLVKTGKLNPNPAWEAWEGFSIQMINNPIDGVQKALVIVSKHHRGVAYGLFHLSRLFGVSPWYWWADVPVAKKNILALPAGYTYQDFPGVKYRGIFINDEAPALSNWSKEKFGGFNAKFYRKVFELMLRLKSNYIWPAMWGNAFYDDDSLNIQAAKDYGIVIGTSHHEPLMRAHDEWRRYGTGKWNYDSNAVNLKTFWQKGMERATNEKIVTIGMRGDGDEPMSRETATALLERIVQDQREIIESTTGKPAESTPQLWALYKEVQDYYDKGMRVPDDVTLLLCDDNWGNIRRLPAVGEKPRKGGYGIYYHFDYVGGPRNYKWINTNHISRIWEQMHLAWQYKAREIWIVNVGDIKPMEFPISFFLDYAWKPEAINANDLMPYTTAWAIAQFGKKHATDIAEILDKYTKYNSRRKPELLDAKTFSVEAGEWDRVNKEYQLLCQQAASVAKALPMAYQDAYFQLVLHPVMASSNLYSLYCSAAMNRYFAQSNDTTANKYAADVRNFYIRDSMITLEYHRLNGGKWNHMMSQTHIGYTYWQQPRENKMPEVKYIPAEAHHQAPPLKYKYGQTVKNLGKTKAYAGLFVEQNGFASANAANYARKQEGQGVSWQKLPGHGRTGDAVTTFPVTHQPLTTGNDLPWLEYDFINYTRTDSIVAHLHFSPTLNFMHLPTGMQFEVSIDGSSPTLVSLNADDNINRTWEKWVANNCIVKQIKLPVSTGEKLTLRYRPVHAGMVLQHLVLDFGGLKPTYLEPHATHFLK